VDEYAIAAATVQAKLKRLDALRKQAKALGGAVAPAEAPAALQRELGLRLKCYHLLSFFKSDSAS
jgi:hypothetical protein